MQKKIKKFLATKEKLKNKKIVLIGASGTIGLALLDELIYLEAKVYVTSSSKAKLKDLLESYNLPYEGIILDFTDYLCIIDAAKEINSLNPDYVIINSGYYNNTLKYNEDKLEYNFVINFFGPYKLISYLNKNIKIIVTESISYQFCKANPNDLCNTLAKKSNLYRIPKRLLFQMTYHLNKEGRRIIYVHPGIVYTPLFEKLNKHGLKKILLPILKLFMMKPSKASLCLIEGLYHDKLKKNEWIGPRLFGHTFGWPKIHKIKKEIFVEEEIKALHKELDVLTNFLEVKYGE